MTVTMHEAVDGFRDRVLPLLVRREAENHLMIGLLHSLSKNPHSYSTASPILLEVSSAEAGVTAAALMTPPYNLLLTAMSSEDLAALTAFVVRKGASVPGVLGPAGVALRFAQLYSQRMSVKPQTRMEQRLYQLERVASPATRAGHLRKADARDLSLLSQWGRDFTVDARLSAHEVVQAPERIRSLIENESLFVWQDSGELRAMAACQGPTRHGIRLSYVFTPRHFRGKGYGAAITAALSQHLLDQGRQFCFLFADLDNPTSNFIYQKVGYQPVCDFHMIVWE